MEIQTVVYEFEIRLSNLEDKYWRKIEITSVSTVAKLAYAIMASFELSGSHLFSIEYDDCSFTFDKKCLKPSDFQLISFELLKGDTLKMIYDFGSDLNFEIKLTAIKEFKKGMGTHYPYVLSGAGAVIPEDLSVSELMEWSEDEYKEYDCESDNALLKGKIQRLQNQYELN